MPDVKQLDWNKLEPETKLPKRVITKSWERKNKVKAYKKNKRVNLKDKRLYADSYDQRNHLKSIMKEEW